MPAPPQNKTTFIFLPSHWRTLLHAYPGNRYDKAPAPLPNELQLLHDLVFQVPRKNDHVVRSGLANPVRMVDRNAAARQETALFIGASVDGVFDQVFANATVMQQGCALSRRAIARNFLALPCGTEQE